MITEAMIAAAVADWMREHGWDVYQEVSLEYQLRGRHPLGDARADLVGTRAPLLSVAECKRELSFELFSQGKRWLPYADLVWIAVPEAKFTDSRREAFDVARNYYGLGVLEFGDDGVRERVPPRIHARADDALLISLQPEHKTYASAGTNRGSRRRRRRCRSASS